MSSPSRDELLAELQRLRDTLGRPPARIDMQERGDYSSSQYDRTFKSWGTALVKAGFRRNTGPGSKKIPTDALLSELERIAETVSSPPRMDDMDEEGLYSSATYINRFGSWKEAVSEAGFTPNKRGGLPPSREELLEDLNRIAEIVGQPITADVIREQSKYSPVSYRNRFETLAVARREAGLTMEHRLMRDVPDEELLRGIQRTAARLGRAPFSHEVESETGYSKHTLPKRFGSYAEAVRAAGYEPSSENSIKRDRLVAELQRVANELGHVPSTYEFEEHGDFSLAPYYRVFGSWDEVRDAVDPE